MPKADLRDFFDLKEKLESIGATYLQIETLYQELTFDYKGEHFSLRKD